jgi:hypothetical protein
VIVEERIYTLYPGKAAEYLKHYQEEGLAVQTRILGRLVGYFTTEIGPLNQVVHMWAYQDLEDRRVRRERLVSDERWKAYIAKVRPYLKTMENKILIPAPFSTVHRVEVHHG